MTLPSLECLDQPELLQMALHAATGSDPHAALPYLKEAVMRPDATAPARFLLASVYAQLNLFDKAIPEMEASLALDPTMGVARFQLGLMHLTTGDTLRALDVLLPLADFGPAHYLAHFGAGLRMLIQNELDAAVQCLATGITLNKDIAAMNDDMRRIIERLDRPGPSAPESLPNMPNMPTLPAGAHGDITPGSPIFLAAYTQYPRYRDPETPG
jgi:tetratricopeptide (TPR) repeat protein